MKKLVVLIAVLLLGFCVSGLVYADSISSLIPVSITVTTGLSFKVAIESEDTAVMDMGDVPQGEQGTGCVIMTVGTNHGKKWYIQVKSSTIASAVPANPSQIPLTNFGFSTLADGEPPSCAGKCESGTFAGGEQTAYTASDDEATCDNVRVVMNLTLNVPSDTPGGDYQATVTATVTD